MSDDHEEAVTEVDERHEDPAGATADQETVAEDGADDAAGPEQAGAVPETKPKHVQAAPDRMAGRDRRRKGPEADGSEPREEASETDDQEPIEDPHLMTAEEIRAYRKEMARINDTMHAKIAAAKAAEKAEYDAMMARKAASTEVRRPIPRRMPRYSDDRVVDQIPYGRRGDEVTDILGIDDPHLAATLLDQALGADGATAVSTESHRPHAGHLTRYQEITGLIRSLEPVGGVEATLATQIAATHNLAMFALDQARRWQDRTEVADRYFSRAMRAMKMSQRSIELLQHGRRRGKQHIVVERVTVESGGQAVVGSVGGAAK